MDQGFGVLIEVGTRAGRPVRFVWRGRLCVVRRVLEQWTAAGDSGARREFWRVEAGAPPVLGVYHLCCESGRWSLLRTGGETTGRRTGQGSARTRSSSRRRTGRRRPWPPGSAAAAVR